MLIGITLSIIVMLIVFSLVLGGDLTGVITEIGVDNTAIVDGVPTSYIIEAQDVIFFIDGSALITSGIALIATVLVMAGLFGIQFLASGLSPESVRIILLITTFIGIWTTLSILAFSLIVSIEVFGSIIYIMLTVGYAVGVLRKISEG